MNFVKISNNYLLNLDLVTDMQSHEQQKATRISFAGLDDQDDATIFIEFEKMIDIVDEAQKKSNKNNSPDLSEIEKILQDCIGVTTQQDLNNVYWDNIDTLVRAAIFAIRKL